MAHIQVGSFHTAPTRAPKRLLDLMGAVWDFWEPANYPPREVLEDGSTSVW